MRFNNSFSNKPLFFTSILKTLWEKEKLLIMSNFFFYPVFSTISEDLLPFLSTLQLSSTNTFSLEQSKICHLGTGYITVIGLYLARCPMISDPGKSNWSDNQLNTVVELLSDIYGQQHRMWVPTLGCSCFVTKPK